MRPPATLILNHPVCVEHDTGTGHPESSDRLRAVQAVLDKPEFADLERREAPRATAEQIGRVHETGYLDGLLTAIPASGLGTLDPDTVISPQSGEAALRAAGAVCAAVDAVAAGEVRNAFCAVRPPGHHAEPGRAMGFCLINNVAVGALHAREVHGFTRIAVVDFDVHHGNGTQAAFERDSNLFYTSTHQYPFYPGTGTEDEAGLGNIVNAPLPADAGSAEFRMAMTGRILPALAEFSPEFLFISAGFDAHEHDPLAQIRLVEDDYLWITGELLAIARTCCADRVVSVLEGGYNLAALAACTYAHVRGLMTG